MHQPDVGKLILRLTLGILMLLHGIHKLTTGIAGIKGMVASAGLPELFAYGVFVGEVIAPLMVIAGFYMRAGALLIVANMLVAIVLVHLNELFALGGSGGWALELQGFFLFTALALVFLGPGKYALRR